MARYLVLSSNQCICLFTTGISLGGGSAGPTFRNGAFCIIFVHDVGIYYSIVDNFQSAEMTGGDVIELHYW